MIVYSIIYLILEVIAIALLAAEYRNYNVWTPDGTIQSAIPTTWFAVFGVSIAVRILTLIGAGIYSKWMVGIAALWEIIYVVLSIVWAITKPTYVYYSTASSSGTYYVSPAASIVFTLIFSGLLFYVSCILFGLNTISRVLLHNI